VPTAAKGRRMKKTAHRTAAYTRVNKRQSGQHARYEIPRSTLEIRYVIPSVVRRTTFPVCSLGHAPRHYSDVNQIRSVNGRKCDDF
jgi:hypothetical protein